MRTARIAGLVSFALIGAFISAGSASAASVGVSKFTVTPAYASGGGSSVTLTAKTSNATSCTLASSPRLKGLPVAVKCASGSSRRVQAIPANASSKARKIVFTFTAKHGSLRATAHVTVHQDPALAKITSFTRSPATANANATTSVKVAAKVTHTKTCTLSSSPKISGLPTSASCTGGSFAKTISIPRNPASNARTITLTLAAKNSIGKSVSRKTTIKQAGASAPTAKLSPSPSGLTGAGGTLTITSTVARGTTCALTSTPNLGSVSRTCGTGSFAKAFSIPANTTGASRSYKFTLKVTGPGGIVTTALTMTQPTQAPPPVQVLTVSSSPASLTAGGGPFTLHATVNGASTCTITSSNFATVPSFDCSSGTVSHGYTIPANSGGARDFSFTVHAAGAGGTATGDYTIGQPAAPVAAPTVVSMTSNPATLTAAGGSVMVTATLTNASTCTWSSTPNTGSAASADCSTNTSSQTFTVPPAAVATANKFTINVTGPGGTATGDLTLNQPGPVSPGVQINSITSSPSSLSTAGGTLTVTANVTSATTCSIASSPNVGTAPSTDCSGGSISHEFSIPANATASDITYTFTVTANGTGGPITATLTITQPGVPPPGPQVTSMSSSPATVDYHGGAFTITAHVTHAATCTLTSSPDIGSKPSTDCSGGTFSGSVTIPANTGSTVVTYAVTVHVTGAGGTASGTLTFNVPPPPPSVTNLSATIPAAGGSVAVTATLSGIDGSSSCALSSTPSVTGTGTQSCTTTSYTRNVTVPPNTSGTTKVYKFKLDVTGPGGTATATVNVNQVSS